jgi:hypothetical protein
MSTNANEIIWSALVDEVEAGRLSVEDGMKMDLEMACAFLGISLAME